MAAAGSIQDLCDEVSCPICLDYFKDPVAITECGHNFCQACLAQFWGASETDISCPQCREIIQGRSFKPNRQLANIVEIAKKLQGSHAFEGEKGRVCEKHQEPLKLFCQDHEAPICVVCDRSKEHRNHNVVPVEEAAQKFKDRILSSLKVLRKERKKCLSYQTETAKEKHELLKQTESEKQKTIAVFGELHQFLEEEEKLLLAQMEEVEKEIAAYGDKEMAILSEEVSSLEKLIQEMEKYQQPVKEFLLDIKSTLEKCQKKESFKSPVPFPPALKWKVWELCDINPCLEGAIKQFKATLESARQLQKANVTLDDNTANPSLSLSVNHRSIKRGEKRQDIPKSRDRFDTYAFVLGCEGFTTGRHCWEVSVGTEGEWSVGVARKSVKRKGFFTCGPQGGIWDVGHWGSGYKAYGDSGDFSLSLNSKPKRVRVTLSCEAGQVSFFDADTAAQIYTYSGVSYAQDILLPIFYLAGEGHLTLSA